MLPIDIPPQPPMFNNKAAWTRAVSIDLATVAAYIHTEGKLLCHIRHVTKVSLNEFPCFPQPKFVIKGREDGKNIYDLLIEVNPKDEVYWKGSRINSVLAGDLVKLEEFKCRTSKHVPAT